MTRWPFRSAITTARRELDHGPHETDPPWTRTVSGSEITVFEAHGKEELGAPAPAVLDDTPQCRRDQAINHGLLILLELGTTLTSGRVLKRLQPVRDVTSAAATAESRERFDAAARALRAT